MPAQIHYHSSHILNIFQSYRESHHTKSILQPVTATKISETMTDLVNPVAYDLQEWCVSLSLCDCSLPAQATRHRKGELSKDHINILSQPFAVWFQEDIGVPGHIWPIVFCGGSAALTVLFLYIKNNNICSHLYCTITDNEML